MLIFLNDFRSCHLIVVANNFVLVIDNTPLQEIESTTSGGTLTFFVFIYNSKFVIFSISNMTSPMAYLQLTDVGMILEWRRGLSTASNFILPFVSLLAPASLLPQIFSLRPVYAFPSCWLYICPPISAGWFEYVNRNFLAWSNGMKKLKTEMAWDEVKWKAEWVMKV
jgi:hypothetical protein